MVRGCLIISLAFLLITTLVSSEIINSNDLNGDISTAVQLSKEDSEKLKEIETIQTEIEDSMSQAENVLKNLQNKVTGNETQPTDEDMLIALKDSVDKLHKDEEEMHEKHLSKDLEIAKSLIAESILDEMNEEVEGDELLGPKSTLLNEQDRYNKKKEMMNLIQTEKDHIEANADDGIKIQDSFVKRNQWKKQLSEEMERNQKEAVKQIDELLNKTLKETLNRSESEDQILKTLNDIPSQVVIEDGWFEDEVTQKNVASVIEEDGKKILQLKEKYNSEEEKKQLSTEIDSVLAKADELHKKFEQEQVKLEGLLNKESSSNKEQENKTIFQINANEEKQMLRKEVENDMKKRRQEQEEEDRNITKEIGFTVIVVLAILFLIFGSQFDIFFFFSQRRRTKNIFYPHHEEEEEEDSKLLSS